MIHNEVSQSQTLGLDKKLNKMKEINKSIVNLKEAAKQPISEQ